MNSKRPSDHPDSMPKENASVHSQDHLQNHLHNASKHANATDDHFDSDSKVNQTVKSNASSQSSTSRDSHSQDSVSQSPAPQNAASQSSASKNQTDEKPHKQSGKNFVMPKGANKTHIKSQPSMRYNEQFDDSTSPSTQTKMNSNGMQTVRYLNGEKLSRPLKMPSQYRRKSYLIILAAALIGVAFLYFYFDTTINAPIREQKMMEERLEQDISLDLPNMISLLPMDDASIITTVESTGATIFNKSAAKEGSSTLELIKLPEGVDLSQAAAMYLKGINKLSGVEAATLLNGSWDLDVNRSKGMNMAIHYADFQSKDIDAAIQNALELQGLDETVLAESGVDNSGNTYASGNVDVDGTTYAWKISALPLNEVYSINGLPDDAIYIGIRFTS